MQGSLSEKIEFYPPPFSPSKKRSAAVKNIGRALSGEGRNSTMGVAGPYCNVKEKGDIVQKEKTRAKFIIWKVTLVRKWERERPGRFARETGARH